MSFHKLIKLNVPEGLTHLPVVGNEYRTGRARELWQKNNIGTLVALKVDPTNAYDKSAVRVYQHDHTSLLHVGYIARDLAADLSAHLKRIGEYGTGNLVVGRLRSGKVISILGVIDYRDMFNFVILYNKQKG